MTILACERRSSPSLPANRILPDGNRFLQDVYDALRPLADKSNGAMLLGDASTLVELRGLIPVRPQPFCLQIVGHGVSGKLNLGRAWTPAVTAPVNVIQADAAELFLLNPGGTLRISEVRLVGCALADSDGEPLLAALSHLFKCDVTASRGETVASQFINGLYAGPMQRFERAGLRYVR